MTGPTPFPFVARAMTPEDRAEIRAATDDAKVIFDWMRPGWFRAQIVQYPRKTEACAASPIEAFRTALLLWREDAA